MDSRLLTAFASICGPDAVIRDRSALVTYECDALVHYRVTPEAVLVPGSAAEVQALVALCHREGVPFVARGHGTGLSGGAAPVEGGVVIALSRLNRVLDVDMANRCVTVEPGVTNLEITRRVAPHGYYYAPDPSSQQACSIGGNVAENSGGAHCLKYGFTVHHVLAADLILPTGERVEVGSPIPDGTGPDLLGLIVGSEGTLGIVTKIVVRILRRPEAVETLLAAFESIDVAGEAVSALIAEGIVPAAAEMMDRLDDPRLRGSGALRVPRRERHPHRGARRRAGGGRRRDGHGTGDLPAVRRERDPDGERRRRARPHLAGAQGGIRRHGAGVAQLLRAGRGRAPDAAARGARTDS